MANKSKTERPFESGQLRARWAIIFLAIGMMLNAFATVADWLQINLLNRIARGQSITYLEETANDDRQALILTLHFWVYVILVVFVLMWIHRANRNLPALGAQDLRFTPRWAVGWFFIPFMSFVRPFQAVAEICKASDPDIDDPTGVRWKAKPVPSILGFWWAAWISVGLLVCFSNVLFRRSNDLAAFLTGTWLTLVADILNIVAAALLIIIIRTITAWQQDKFD
ncbi:MAG TPA: DUF4328 domain-containing protein [Chloroflexia bacterium]|nr:DUF4328 domain-containing protein [Chloroflexia bacterium]